MKRNDECEILRGMHFRQKALYNTLVLSPCQTFISSICWLLKMTDLIKWVEKPSQHRFKRKQFKTCFCLFCINFFIFLPLFMIYLLPAFLLISFLEDPFFFEIFRIGLEISIGYPKHYVIFSLLCLFYYSLFSWFLLCLLSFF